MKWIFSEEHIFLEQEEIQKVCRLLEEELGITNIRAINATLDGFEIVRLCSDEKDSLASDISDVKTIKSIQNFKKFYEGYSKKKVR